MECNYHYASMDALRRRLNNRYVSMGNEPD